jgi:hypothetical protein
MDSLTARIIETAREHGLARRDPTKYEYINLCWKSSCGHVVAQIHEYIPDPGGRVLVIGNPGNDCPMPSPLQHIEDCSQLSGDRGSNKPWLRATGRTFGHRAPARSFFLPNRALEGSDSSPVWKSVTALLMYAVNRMGSR